jgi:hypothetical protein
VLPATIHLDEITLATVSATRIEHLSRAELATLFRDVRSGAREHLGALEGVGALLVDLDAGRDVKLGAVPRLLATVVVGFGRRGPTPTDLDGLDVILSEEPGPGAIVVDDPAQQAEELAGKIDRSAPAAVTLVQVLRSGEHLEASEALLYESLAYSTLQSGRVFGAWLAGRGAPVPDEEDGAELVLLSRRGAELEITLNRPERRNALGARLRDALCDALEVAAADPGVGSVILSGAGPSFSSGGDLNEFGSAADGALAHLVRTTRSPGARLAALRQVATARIHGACIGAGIELPAFAGRVEARRDTRIALPEVAMGLIPGAGGTVSIPRRVGRHRTGWLALSGEEIGAEVALEWGLVDHLEADA